MKFLGQDIGLLSFVPDMSRLGPFAQSREYEELREIKESVRDIANTTAEYSPGPYEIASYDNGALSAQFEALQESNNALLEAQSIADDSARQSRREQTWVLEEIREAQGQHIAITSMMLQSIENSEANLDAMVDAFDEINHGLAKFVKQFDGTAARFMKQQARIAQENNRLADRRHAELIDVIRQPAQNAADEKFAHGAAQFKAGHLALAAKDLRSALGHVSVHVPSLLLLGRICVERGLAKEAKAFFHRAATHATQQNNRDAYVAAMIRLSHVERVVGNVKRAHSVMVETRAFLDKHDGGTGSDRRRRYADYEELKARWAIPTNQRIDVALAVAWELQRLFYDSPQLRQDVANLPLFASLRKLCPWFNEHVGNRYAPFGDANEAVHFLLPLVERLVAAKGVGDDDIETVFVRALRFMATAPKNGARGIKVIGVDELFHDVTPTIICGFIQGERKEYGSHVKQIKTVIVKYELVWSVMFLELKASLAAYLANNPGHRKQLPWKEAERVSCRLASIAACANECSKREVSEAVAKSTGLFAPYSAALQARAESERINEERRVSAERLRLEQEAAARAAQRQVEFEARWGPGEAGRKAEQEHARFLARKEFIRAESKKLGWGHYDRGVRALVPQQVEMRPKPREPTQYRPEPMGLLPFLFWGMVVLITSSLVPVLLSLIAWVVINNVLWFLG